MARYVTISSLGPAKLFGVKLFGQEAIDYMIEHWNNQIKPVLADKPDLIILPEACDRFPQHSMEERKEYYQFRGNKMLDFFSGVARENNCYIAYSAARLMQDGTFRNSTQLIDRQGKVTGIYNKNHLVIEEKTIGGILYGKDAPVFETDFGTVACAICFDLNYHELINKYAAQRPDLIIFCSMYHGGLMQNYMAYHCRAHFAGAIAGEECTIINPVGEKIACSTNYFNRVTATVNLDCKVVHLDYNWEKLQAAKDKYGSGVKVFDPGHLGSVLLSAEAENLNIDDIIREFQIEIWDEYYNRSMQHRHSPGNIED
jgi:hypothetical protein